MRHHFNAGSVRPTMMPLDRDDTLPNNDGSHLLNQTRSKSEVLDRLTEILFESFEVERSAINLDSDMKEDLDLDSIDAVDLAVCIEEAEGVSLSEDEIRSIRLVRDLVNLVHKALGDQAAGSTL